MSCRAAAARPASSGASKAPKTHGGSNATGLRFYTDESSGMKLCVPAIVHVLIGVWGLHVCTPCCTSACCLTMWGDAPMCLQCPLGMRPCGAGVRSSSWMWHCVVLVSLLSPSTLSRPPIVVLIMSLVFIGVVILLHLLAGGRRA